MVRLFRKKTLKNVAIPLVRDNLAGLVSNLTLSAMNKFDRKINGKGFTLFVLNEGVDDIIKIIKSLEDSGVLIDGFTETIKEEIKNTRGWISWSFASTFSCFISTTSNFFSSKRYKWKKVRKRIYD